MESRTSAVRAVVSEKASQIKHEDNLKLEGSLDMKRRGTITLRTEKENTAKMEDNLKTEQSSAKHTQVNSAVDSKSFENIESRFCH